MTDAEKKLPTKSSITGLAYFLSENELIEKQAAIKAVSEAKEHGVSFTDYLVKNQLVDSSLLTKFLSTYYSLPCCDITTFDLTLIPKEFLSLPFVKKRTALPIFNKNGYLFLAVSDPTAVDLRDISFLTGLKVKLLLADRIDIDRLLDSFLSTLIISEFDDTTEAKKIVSKSAKDDEVESYDVDSAPVINYVNKIIINAIEKGASDIHFERFAKEYRIRYRINGVLYSAASPPLKIANFLLTRIKIMSNLDITEHRIPQDGRFKINASKYKTIDFRVSVCPTLYGEKIVLRLLDPSRIFHSIDELGMTEEQRVHVLDALSRTQGFILVTGPTGSGKTVTLYSSLNHLNNEDVNIMTVEDPIEIPLHGVNQVHVNPNIGLTFSSTLRSFLRQDPDIIMVGEIRDLETAQISVQASQTGHLVLSTLHTNTGPETIARLLYMGVEPYNIASSLILVIAQRLIRKLCNHCKKEEKIPMDILLQEGFTEKEIPHLKLFGPGTCDNCIDGYHDRTGIFEVLPITDDMRYLIIRNANAMELAAQAKKEHIKSLRDMGLEKVKQGVTSLTELNRTFK